MGGGGGGWNGHCPRYVATGHLQDVFFEYTPTLTLLSTLLEHTLHGDIINRWGGERGEGRIIFVYLKSCYPPFSL